MLKLQHVPDSRTHRIPIESRAVGHKPNDLAPPIGLRRQQITDLHYILQITMGWSDDHLNRFRIHGKQYGVYRLAGLTFSDDPDAVRLRDFRFRINERFLYEYDFTDGWKHQVRVENILAHEARRDYPVCTGGKRACPPEDCGGRLRFLALREHYSLFYIMERMLEIIENGGTEDYEEDLNALNYWFHVDRFDRKEANRRLYDHARGKDVFMWL